MTNDNVRWVLVVPGVICAFVTAFLIGVSVDSVTRKLCPPDRWVSGTCDVPWWGYVEHAVWSLGAGLAAALVVWSATFIAPHHKRRVAWVTFTLGACAATVFAFMFIFEWVVALASGAITAAIVSRRASHDA